MKNLFFRRLPVDPRKCFFIDFLANEKHIFFVGQQEADEKIRFSWGPTKKIAFFCGIFFIGLFRRPAHEKKVYFVGFWCFLWAYGP